MGMYAVQTADSAELAELRGGARDGAAAARSRRRQLAQGKQALTGGVEPAAAAAGAGAPLAENPDSNGAGPPPAASDGRAAPNGMQPATGGVAAAHLGRTLSKERRRQLSQGRQALNGNGAPPTANNAHVNGAGSPPAASNGQGAPSGARQAPSGAGVATGGVAAAHLGRALSKERRRQLSQGKQALTAGAGQTAAAAGVGAPSGARQAPSGAGVAADGVAAAHLGRALSKERRRQLSQGRQALTAGAGQTAAAAGVGSPPAATNVQVNGTQAASDGVAAAHLGRALSKERRRQLSQGKQALNGAGAPPRAKDMHVDGAGSSGEQARAPRPEASRFGSPGIGAPQREGRVRQVPKVVASPTHGGQQVTGLRIGPGVRVTGDEPGAGLPVSGTQYVGADAASAAPGAGPKVGLVRTPQGLVVSGTTVRNKVAITGDEFGEHLTITGEADQKFDDDLTPRRDGTYRAAQFPRRADPHGASAVGTRLVPQPGVAASTGDGPWHPLETTAGQLAVTGTAVGRSGRVTGNEAGACRPITGDQYQGLSAYSSECGGTGGGTAPAAHLNRARLDPATGGKVTVAQTWGGQRVTGPGVEYRLNVTGDEPGVCDAVTGTPYHGPSSTVGWCEPDQVESAAKRLASRPEGVAVTGDIPMHVDAVTGTGRGHGHNVTGTSYYRDLRPAEPAADDWTGSKAFPVALARRLADGQSDDAATPGTDDAPPHASSVPGRITGSFAVGEGMVTGNNEFLFRARASREGTQPAVTGEGRTDGRTITGSLAAWTSHDRVTGTEGYIAAGRNPSEGGGAPHGWAGAGKFGALATPEGPRQTQNVTGLSGWSSKAAARVTLSGGARG